MRSNYPQYFDYQMALENMLTTIGKNIALQSYDMLGAPTNLEVKVINPTEVKSPVPNMMIVLQNVYNGHDDDRTGVPMWNDFDFTPAGTNLKQSVKSWPERLQYSIIVKAQQYNQCITIMQELRRQLMPYGFIAFQYIDSNISTRYELDNFRIGYTEDKNTVGSYTFTLFTQQDAGNLPTFNLPITAVSSSYTGSIG